jgi:sugar phosphate permease
MLASIRGLEGDRLAFLGYVTGGHVVIHWYQQMFAVALPTLKQGLGLSDVEVGYLQSARQLTAGSMNLPVGMLADSMAGRQGALLGAALLFMGLGYLALGTTPALGGALLGAALVGSARPPGTRRPPAVPRGASRSGAPRRSPFTGSARPSATR